MNHGRSLAPGLMPLLTRQTGGLFLPWSVANSQAIANGEEEFTVTLNGQTWRQKPQKYHARSLAVLKTKYQQVSGNEALNDVLNECHCLTALS